MTRLALVMIVRNEARSLARCLESVRGVVDRIIVLDTGSTDATVEIARSLGAEVHHAPWPNDFAAARNAALDLSDADWNLILDGDEWLQGGAEALALLPPLGGGTPAFVGCGRIAEADSSGDMRVFAARLLPRGVRFAGRVHEQPATDLPQALLPLTIGHDGYAPAQLAAKQGRNEALLRAGIAERPDDPLLHYHLGRQHYIEGRHGEAADSFVAANRLAAPDLPIRLSLVVYTIVALRLAGRFEEALALVDAEQDNWEHAPDFFYAVAELYLEWAYRNPETARDELLPVVECAWLKCLQIGEKPELTGSIEGIGSWRAAEKLAHLYAALGLDGEAGRYAAMSRDMRAGAKVAA
ncbi:glycosyltransferase [Sphingomonas parva]|uniref:Glycosyltransferase n=1 Tax=Sphingomonas parva TaxID=2555898 RepID=A0A4Y8ZUE5_9SPHN|nr:glycosyltransferase family 2 protein [Sphingomonas parva]TFI59630.1 glycosyltransferase [Sphingomonas parva]